VNAGAVGIGGALLNDGGGGIGGVGMATTNSTKTSSLVSDSLNK
jgi:hypothetical protein